MVHDVDSILAERELVDTELDQAHDALKVTLSDQPVDFAALVHEVANATGLSDSTVVAALWEVIDLGEGHLTADLRVSR